jgi:hypothetical protein
MFLAGVPVPDGVLRNLAGRLRSAGLGDTADKLERAWSQENKTLALETDDPEALLRVLADGPDELEDLRSVLLQEHERRRAGGH